MLNRTLLKSLEGSAYIPKYVVTTYNRRDTDDTSPQKKVKDRN